MVNNILQLVRSEPWQVAIELVVIWTCVYLVFRFLRGTRGAGVVKGFVVLAVIATLTIRVLGSSVEALARLTYIYDRFLTIAAVLLVVVFQPELRQAMIRIGYAWNFRAGRGAVRGVVEAVTEAVAFLSKAQFGALIAIERTSRLGGLVEAGTMLDAEVSDRLLESIFWPNSPLHDLGVVIRGDRIVAASVQFPLVEEGVLSGDYGSRHRAAVGLSMESDCVVVIVSEETGGISIAESGRLESGISREDFAAVLAARLSATPDERPEPTPVDTDATPEPELDGEPTNSKKHATTAQALD